MPAEQNADQVRDDAAAAPAAPAIQTMMLPQSELSRLILFRGNDKDAVSAEKWAGMVDKHISVLKWNSEQTAGAAIECMRDEVARWEENIRNNNRKKHILKDWTQLRVEFLKRWGTKKTHTAKVQSLGNLKQAGNESTEIFQDKVTYAINNMVKGKIDNLNSQEEINAFQNCREAFEVALFVSGLQRDIRKYVEWEMKENSSSDEVFEMARKAEEAFNSEKIQKNAKVALLQAGKDTMQEPTKSELKGELLQEIRAMLDRNNGQVAAIGSAKGGPNGRKRTPLKDKPMAERPPVFCFKCKQWGKHILKECKLSTEEIARLTPQSRNDKPTGTVTDQQYPNA